jgi:hypothetical protein
MLFHPHGLGVVTLPMLFLTAAVVAAVLLVNLPGAVRSVRSSGLQAVGAAKLIVIAVAILLSVVMVGWLAMGTARFVLG